MFQTLEYEGKSHRAVSRSFGVVSKRATPFAPETDREELRKNGRRITSEAPSGTPSALRNRSWGDDKEESRVRRAVASDCLSVCLCLSASVCPVCVPSTRRSRTLLSLVSSLLSPLSSRLSPLPLLHPPAIISSGV